MRPTSAPLGVADVFAAAHTMPALNPDRQEDRDGYDQHAEDWQCRLVGGRRDLRFPVEQPTLGDPVPPGVTGPHGAASGTVEITKVTCTWLRDNYGGDKKHVNIDIKNTGSGATGFDLYESWIS